MVVGHKYYNSSIIINKADSNKMNIMNLVDDTVDAATVTSAKKNSNNNALLKIPKITVDSAPLSHFLEQFLHFQF